MIKGQCDFKFRSLSEQVITLPSLVPIDFLQVVIITYLICYVNLHELSFK